jgi:hypothetical protein
MENTWFWSNNNETSMITMIKASTVSRIRNRVVVIGLWLLVLVLLFLLFWLSRAPDNQKRENCSRVHSFFLQLKMFKTTGGCEKTY